MNATLVQCCQNESKDSVVKCWERSYSWCLPAKINGICAYGEHWKAHRVQTTRGKTNALSGWLQVGDQASDIPCNVTREYDWWKALFDAGAPVIDWVPRGYASILHVKNIETFAVTGLTCWGIESDFEQEREHGHPRRADQWQSSSRDHPVFPDNKRSWQGIEISTMCHCQAAESYEASYSDMEAESSLRLIDMSRDLWEAKRSGGSEKQNMIHQVSKR